MRAGAVGHEDSPRAPRGACQLCAPRARADLCSTGHLIEGALEEDEEDQADEEDEEDVERTV